MEKLHVRIILEILGRPAGYIKNSLNSLIDTRLAKDPGVTILKRDVKEPVKVESTQDLFTTFSELELELKSLDTLFGLVFAYMPAHIEIISPAHIEISNNDLTSFTNKLALRLHDYDALTKQSQAEKEMLIQKLREVSPNLFKQAELQSQIHAAKNKAAKGKKSKKSKKN